MLTCPITQEPPFDPVHLDIPDDQNQISEQVYSTSAIFQMISTRGWYGVAVRNLVHPLNCQIVPRTIAMTYVRNASNELQNIIHVLRRRLNLPMEDDQPITDADRAEYDETLAFCAQRYVFLYICIHVNFFHILICIIIFFV